MAKIHLTRCQHLSPFVDILNGLGSPTVSLLAKFRLPTSLEGKANHYVPIFSAIEFAEFAYRSQGIEDFGFHASRQLHFGHLSEKTRNLIGLSPTLLVALQQTCKWASLEDSNLSNWLERHDDHVRICSRLAGSKGLLHLEHSQWLQNIFPIYIVRQFAGPDWAPATIAFEARYTPSPACQSFWPRSRFLSGQEASWIDDIVAGPSQPRERGYSSSGGRRGRSIRLRYHRNSKVDVAVVSGRTSSGSRRSRGNGGPEHAKLSTQALSRRPYIFRPA
jgi:hypothetical protein